MILDMNLQLDGIDEAFLEDLEDLIEDTRVEYFIINPNTQEELEKTKILCSDYERFKYSLPIEFKDMKDDNCIAYRIKKPDDMGLTDSFPLIIDSQDLSDEMINILNNTDHKGVILNAKESDNKLENFAFAISHSSLSHWSQEGITDMDYNKIALQSDYPEHSYDDLMGGLLKDISDLTFRAEQTLAAGGTRTALKTFGLL